MVDSLDVALAKIDPESDEYIPLDSANILQLVKVIFWGLFNCNRFGNRINKFNKSGVYVGSRNPD